MKQIDLSKLHSTKHQIGEKEKSAAALFMAALLCGLSGCAAETNAPTSDSSASAYISVIEDDGKPLNMKKLLFSYSVYYPESEDKTSKYFVFVQSDGSIYTGVYRDMYRRFEFQQRLYNFDNVDFGLLDDVGLLGHFSEAETEKLCGLIANVDTQSKAYERGEAEPIPTVFDTAWYVFYCYPTDSKKTAFQISSSGNLTGASYRTYDKNALEAFKLVCGNSLITEWEDALGKENGV